MQTRFEEAITRPRGVYGEPSDVLADDALTGSQKREVLERWKAEAIHLQESTAEGFGGGEQSHLDDVVDALSSLNESLGS